MKYIDLTQLIENNMPVFPGDFPVKLAPLVTYEKDGFANHKLECSLHIGTHIDAPGHFTNNDKKICDFAVTKFIGQAKLIDVRGSQEITIDHVKNQIGLAKIVIFFTGFGNLFKAKNYFADYPVLTDECAEYLVSQNVEMVGLDSPSVDKSPYDIHKILLSNDVLIIENLINLEQLLGKDFEIIALPLKIDAHGAPARVIAKIK